MKQQFLARSSIVLSFVLLMLTACNAPVNTPTTAPVEEVGTAVPTADGYPAPAATTDSAYPLPTPNSPYPYPGANSQGSAPTTAVDSGPLVVPTATAESGVVTGVFSNNTNEDSVAVTLAGRTLFLAKVLTNAEGVAGLVEMDRASAPSAELNANGEFAFTDVAPGSYGVMLDTVQGPQLLNDPATGNSIVIEVVAGQVLDLGTKVFTIPGDF
jgi:hypothetical protein